MSRVTRFCPHICRCSPSANGSAPFGHISTSFSPLAISFAFRARLRVEQQARAAAEQARVSELAQAPELASGAIALTLPQTFLSPYALTWVFLPAIEAFVLPFAISALVTGFVRMRGNPMLHSWPTLGPGLALALVPSWLATMMDAQLWRSVALGIAALVVLPPGARLRLQAPLVVGAIVLVLHAIVQLTPSARIVYESVLWWVWIGIGGILLICIAATYEKRMAQLRAFAHKIGSLR